MHRTIMQMGRDLCWDCVRNRLASKQQAEPLYDARVADCLETVQNADNLENLIRDMPSVVWLWIVCGEEGGVDAQLHLH